MNIKKKLLLGVVSVALAFNLVGCGKGAEKETGGKGVEGETEVIRWVRGHAGNPMMSMARENGYLEEYGIKVEEIPMQTTNDSFAALSSGKIDIISNAGTGLPLQYIASGEDVEIFGGHMVSGSVKLLGKAGTSFKGIEDIVGKKVAGAGAHSYQFSGPLLDKGYDPIKDVDWVEMEAADAMAAVAKGEVDFASVGTELTQKAYELEEQGALIIAADSNELVKNYSCCRMETSGEFIKKNPETTKRLLKALIRGQKDFEADKSKAVDLLAEELDSPKNFVESYMKDEGYILHVDPLYNSCVRAWDWFERMGLLDENAKDIDLKNFVNVDIYKQALDEVIEEVGDEDPEYWDKVVGYFEENNSKYYE